MIAIAIVVLLVVGGGASVAAENAAPGEALYSVKTTVNENVRAMVAMGVEADAKWEAKLTERRLKEAEKLSADGKLTTEVAADLGAKAQAHAEAALAMAAELRAKGETEAAAEVESEVNAAITANSGLANALLKADEHATASIQTAIDKINARVRVSGGGSTEGSADARVNAGDVNGDGRLDAAADSNAGGSVRSETKTEVNTGGASVNASGTIKIEL